MSSQFFQNRLNPRREQSLPPSSSIYPFPINTVFEAHLTNLSSSFTSPRLGIYTIITTVPRLHHQHGPSKKMNLTNLLLAALALTLASATPVPQQDGEDGDTGDNYVQCLSLCNGDSVPCLNSAKDANVTVLGVSFLWCVLS